MRLISELRRRNVLRMAALYSVAAWLIVQVAEVLIDLAKLPDWIGTTTLWLLAIGFPIALIFSWFYEITPQGISLEKDVNQDSSITQATGRRLDFIVISLLCAAVILFAYDKWWIGLPPEASIAVLPFVNMSSDPEQEYFSDGITEEILNHLAKNRALLVAARTSAFSFKGQDRDIRQIGGMLGVGTILEGSVRKDGEYIRITAQLIRVSDGFHLWSESYDRKLENILAIQDDIASQIAVSLQIPLGITTNQPGHSEKLVNPEAYDLYLQARALHRQRGRGGLLEALELFQKALDIDPQFASAWAGLAHTYNDISFRVSEEELVRLGDVTAKSMVAAKKALELNPGLATALHAMANSQRRKLEWASAQEYYETALKYDPEAADVMEDYAYLLLNSLQFKASKRVIEHMLALDPYVAKNYGVVIDLYNTLGEFDKRDHYIQTALDINPEYISMQNWNFTRLLQYGELQKAHNYVDQVNQPGSAIAQSYHQMIDWMAVQEQPLDKAMQDAGVSSHLFAYVSGNYELWLTMELELTKPGPPFFVTFSRSLAPIVTPEQVKQNLANPRTHELVQALRLPEYWREVGWPDICRPIGEHDFVCE
jgi:TolB-like protein